MSFFTNLIQKADTLLANSTFLQHAISDPSISGPLDNYLGQLKVKIATNTHMAVYTEAHDAGMAEHMRTVLEKGVDVLPLKTPDFLTGPAAALLQAFQGKLDSQGKQETGVVAFFKTVVERNHLDKEVRRSAVRSTQRYAEEHKSFLQSVGMEALVQKLRGKVEGTERAVPYVKPPPLSKEEFDTLYPVGVAVATDERDDEDRGLFGSLIQGVVQSIGKPQTVLESVLHTVGNDTSVQAKLDEYAQEIRVVISKDTERVCYEQCHSQQFQSVLRKIVEHAVEKLPINPPAALSGPIATYMEQYVHPQSRDITGPEGFFSSHIKALGLEQEVRHSVLRALEHFLQEHKQFLMRVGLESLFQKLQGHQVSGTEKAVPYVKPTPPLTLEEFEKKYPDQHPIAPQAQQQPTQVQKATAEKRDMAAQPATTTTTTTAAAGTPSTHSTSSPPATPSPPPPSTSSGSIDNSTVGESRAFEF